MRTQQRIFLSFFSLFVMGFLNNGFAFSFFDNDVSERWQGIYLSGQLGSAWVHERAKFTNPNFFNTLGPQVLGSNFRFSSHRFVGGGAVGANYQWGCFVIGAEGGAYHIHAKETRRSPFFPDSDRYTSNLRWFAAAKARLGYAYKRILPFITGGWVGGDVSLRLRDMSSGRLARASKWTNGWTAGIGADYKLSNCLSVGVAYDYNWLEYKNETISCPTCGTGVGFGTPKVTHRLRVHTVLLRLNYNFAL